MTSCEKKGDKDEADSWKKLEGQCEYELKKNAVAGMETPSGGEETKYGNCRNGRHADRGQGYDKAPEDRGKRD